MSVPGPEAADPEYPLFRRYGRESRRDAGTARTGVLEPIADVLIRRVIGVSFP